MFCLFFDTISKRQDFDLDAKWHDFGFDTKLLYGHIMTQIDTNISDLIQIDMNVSNWITFLVLRRFSVNFKLSHELKNTESHCLPNHMHTRPFEVVEFIYYYITCLNTKGIYCPIAFFGQTRLSVNIITCLDIYKY